MAVRALAPLSDAIIVVVPPDLTADPDLADRLGLGDLKTPLVSVAGGATRAASVRAGLSCVPEDCAFVLVHDAARPLASPELVAGVLAALASGAKAVVPGLPVTDTVKRVEGETVVATLDRSSLVSVQTPQGFSAEVLRRAHEKAPEATDDAGLVEALGEPVVVVPGEVTNLKVTSPADLALARFYWEKIREEKP
jgi:2-C-methyl-D-erythritol 4-phosphate cytidylyltransferase